MTEFARSTGFTGVLPALESTFDYSKSKAALTPLSGHPPPDGLRSIGIAGLTVWLKRRSCRNSATVAQKAIEAVNTRHTMPALGAIRPSNVIANALRARLPPPIVPRQSQRP
ncbi:hypothetical protein B2J88_46305 [Rhodococcus sp. SRB_17]|nr:hypothetical protein [Rhodococcus sp. SRB_17]